LIFKSKNISYETQILEPSTEPSSIDKLSYIYSIGDNLAQWTSYLCFDLGESDYYRLNEVLQILTIWESEQIYKKTFIDLMKRYILPAHQVAKNKYQVNQALSAQVEEPQSILEV
jgi:hypothetical protein